MLCGQNGALEVVKAFDSPQKLLAEIDALDFDLLICDIEMPGADGLSVARALKGKLVIFCTAYKEYAADAFDVDAVDYITKPVRPDRLQRAVEKAVARFEKNYLPAFSTFNTDKGKAVLYFGQIALVRTGASDSRDKEVLLGNGASMLLKNISFEQLLAVLPADGFCRINKQELVALSSVRFFAHNEITLHQSNASGKAIALSLNEKYRANFLQKMRL